MKKITVVCVMFMLIFAGCSREQATDPGNEAVVETSPVVAQMAEAAQRAVNQAYGDNSEVQVTVTARGEAIVYTYRALNDISATADEIAAGLDNGKKYYDDLLNEMRKSGVKNPSAVLEYLDKDGAMIYTREFK